MKIHQKKCVRLALVFAALLLNFAEPARVQADSWKFAGFMSTNRQLLTATLLPRGKVLVAGGFVNAGAATNTAEFFDPVTGTWANTPTMGVARGRHPPTPFTHGQNPLATGDNTIGPHTHAPPP